MGSDALSQNELRRIEPDERYLRGRCDSGETRGGSGRLLDSIQPQDPG